MLIICIGCAGFSCVNDIKKQRMILDEVISFIQFLKSELNYRATDFYTIGKFIECKGYKYITFEQEDVLLSECKESYINSEFKEFVANIGTTDSQGQIALCDMYIARFTEYIEKHKQTEKSKIRVSTALSVLSALTVAIIFC